MERDCTFLRQNLTDYLWQQSIERLRAVARKVGVERATTKKKGELVEEILAVEEGKIPPVNESKRGAPIKNNFVDPEILSKIEEYRLSFYAAQYGEDTEDREAFSKSKANDEGYLEFHSPDFRDVSAFDSELYIGQLALYRDVHCLFPLDGNYEQQGENLTVISASVVEKYGLKEGDIIAGRVERRGKISVLTRISSIGGRMSNLERFDFEEEKTSYPEEKVRFSDYGYANIATKTLDLFAPCSHGDRVLIAADGRRGQTEFITQLIGSLYTRTDVRLIVLSLSSSPERAANWKEVLGEEQLIVSTYEQGAEHAVFAAEFALARAKRLAERRQKVCLIVDSFNALVRAYDESEKSEGSKTLACGLQSKSLQFVKAYLGAGRNFFNRSSSLTVIGGMSLEQEDGADELLRRNLSDVATVYVKLKAKPNFLSPTPDFAASSSDRKWSVLSEEEKRFVLYCSSEYLSKMGEDALLTQLNTEDTIAATMQKIISD